MLSGLVKCNALMNDCVEERPNVVGAGRRHIHLGADIERGPVALLDQQARHKCTCQDYPEAPELWTVIRRSSGLVNGTQVAEEWLPFVARNTPNLIERDEQSLIAIETPACQP